MLVVLPRLEEFDGYAIAHQLGLSVNRGVISTDLS